MAYWNAPVPVDDHADAAVQTAIRQIELLEEINTMLQGKYRITLQIGIGIHTGVVTAGDMGSQGRSDYTVIGDNVNIASRLEGLTKVYHAQILISKATYEQLTHTYTVRPIDIVELKGKRKSIEVFEVICDNKAVTKEELNKYEEAIALYRQAKLFDALSLFTQLRQDYTDPLYALYETRCQAFIHYPKDKFSPITKMHTK
jgi:adenylate cyclase